LIEKIYVLQKERPSLTLKLLLLREEMILSNFKAIAPQRRDDTLICPTYKVLTENNTK